MKGRDIRHLDTFRSRLPIDIFQKIFEDVDKASTQDYLLGLLDEAFSSKHRLTKGDMINTTEALDATDEMMRDAIEDWRLL